MLDVGDRLAEQLADMVVIEVGDDPAPVPTTHHEAEMTQQPQLVRHGGRLHLDGDSTGERRIQLADVGVVSFASSRQEHAPAAGSNDLVPFRDALGPRRAAEIAPERDHRGRSLAVVSR